MPKLLKAIATTRFTTETYAEYNRFAAKAGRYWYGTPRALPQTIDLARGTLVLEMNNNTNKLEGAGLVVANESVPGRRRMIYNDLNWCRYTYPREGWINATDLQEELGEEMWTDLHHYLFKGVGNQKRWTGITGWGLKPWSCANPECAHHEACLSRGQRDRDLIGRLLAIRDRLVRQMENERCLSAA
jgi:hypothetical protein